MPTEELLQCFDNQGDPTEARPKSEVKKQPHRWWHATASTWLVNDRCQIMCSKRAESNLGNPGKWQTYFGGHVSAGQSFLEAAQRELREETGIDKPIIDFFLVQERRSEEIKMILLNFAVRFNGEASDLSFQDGEITEAKWMDMEDYWREKEKKPDSWCNRCTPAQQEIIRHWIAKL